MPGETMRVRQGMQSALRLLFPPQCATCGAQVSSDFGLCTACWIDTPFIAGLVCDGCGVPLQGQDDGRREYCDDCLGSDRVWQRGRAAMVYKDNARRIVLALKHGDRLDLARPAGEWLWRAARPILTDDMLVAPVPLHWTRLVRRRFNQSALLSQAVARLGGLDHCPDLLLRARRTGSQDGRDRDGRFGNVAGAIRAHPRRAARMRGRDVLIVDDVMTSGATFSAAAEACLAAGAATVSVLALARVGKDA